MYSVDTNSVNTSSQALGQFPVSHCVSKDRVGNNLSVREVALEIWAKQECTAAADENRVEASTAIPELACLGDHLAGHGLQGRIHHSLKVHSLSIVADLHEQAEDVAGVDGQGKGPCKAGFIGDSQCVGNGSVLLVFEM
jgi:hypothetical protein